MNRRRLNGRNLCNHKQKVFGTNAQSHMDIKQVIQGNQYFLEVYFLAACAAEILVHNKMGF